MRQGTERHSDTGAGRARPVFRRLLIAATLAAVSAAGLSPAWAIDNHALVYQDQVTARAFAEIEQGGMGNVAGIRQGGQDLPYYDTRFGPRDSYVSPTKRAAFDAALAQRAGEANEGNVTTIRQYGSESVAQAFQAGSNNFIEIGQQGQNNAAFAAAVGDSNTIGIAQQGRDHSANVVFVGDGNQADVAQTGIGQAIGIEHFGSGSAWHVDNGSITRVR